MIFVKWELRMNLAKGNQTDLQDEGREAEVRSDPEEEREAAKHGLQQLDPF